MIAVGQSIATAVLEHDLGVLTGVPDVIHLDTGSAQDGEHVSKRPAHPSLLPEQRLRTARSTRLHRADDLSCVRAGHARSESAATRVGAHPLCLYRGGGAPASMPPAR